MPERGQSQGKRRSRCQPSYSQRVTKKSDRTYTYDRVVLITLPRRRQRRHKRGTCSKETRAKFRRSERLSEGRSIVLNIAGRPEARNSRCPRPRPCAQSTFAKYLSSWRLRIFSLLLTFLPAKCTSQLALAEGLS